MSSSCRRYRRPPSMERCHEEETVAHEEDNRTINLDDTPDLPYVIDLTAADVVDLTSPTPIMILGRNSDRHQRRRRRVVTLHSDDEAAAIHLDVSETELRVSGDNSTSKTSVDDNPKFEEFDRPASSSVYSFVCSVCLDDIREIYQDSRTLMSTVCGHVFCSACLKAIMQEQPRCPSCRKVLTQRSIHPLHI